MTNAGGLVGRIDGSGNLLLCAAEALTASSLSLLLFTTIIALHEKLRHKY